MPNTHNKKIDHFIDKIMLSIIDSTGAPAGRIPWRRRRLVVRIATQHRTIHSVSEHLFKLTGYFHMHMCASVTHARTRLYNKYTLFAHNSHSEAEIYQNSIWIIDIESCSIKCYLLAAICRMLNSLSGSSHTIIHHYVLISLTYQSIYVPILTLS